jgi:hypothetical protein
MSDVTEDAWFFTRNGEQLGPVTLDELRDKASNRELDPRHDMVWCSGMAEWKPAGEIEGLFARRETLSAPVGQTMAPAPNPYESGIDETSETLLAREAEWPGVKRFGYIVGSILLGVVSGVVPMILLPVIQPTLGEPNTGWVMLGLQLLFAVLFPIVLAGKRFVNLGMTAWWLLGMLVPFLNWWLGYRLFACPPGYAMHRKMDGVGIFLAIVYWLFLAAMVALVALVIVAMLGIAGSPELQQQIKDAMEQAAARQSS